MTGTVNNHRIFSLSDVNAYPGSDVLDRVIQFFPTKTAERRIWLVAPSGEPVIWIDELELRSQSVTKSPVRWLDYGVVSVPILQKPLPKWDGLARLRFKGLDAAVCAQSYLIITPRLDLNLAGLTITAAQEALWGLSQDKAGQTSVRPSTITAGTPTTFTGSYSAGADGLPAGALVRFYLPRAFSLPQTADPAAPGYTRLHDDAAGVEIIDMREALESHEVTSIICRLNQPLRPGQSFSISYRTEKLFIYPAVLGETELRTWFSKVPPLAASVALSAGHPYVPIRPQDSHKVEVVPGLSERLHLMLPGRRYASEQLFLHGVFTDYYRNVPPEGLITADIVLHLEHDGQTIELGRPTHHFQARHTFRMPLPPLEPGIYRAVAVDGQSGRQTAVSNPLEIVPDGTGERLYWGEIHSHTGLSDGGGDFSGVFRHARDEGGLEFATVTDHAEYISDNQWEWMQDVINRWQEDGRFVTLVGYEWIGKQADRIIYTARDRLPLFRGDDPAYENLDDFWGHFDGDEQVVGGPHATLVHQTKWEQHNSNVERYAEIYSMWGSCDFRDSPLVAPWIGPERGITVNDILKQGAKLGFTAGGDCHDGRVGFTSEDPDGQGTTPHTFAAIILFRCGMTAASMPDLSRRSLVAALRRRRTYATTGARMLLSFEVSGVPMGGQGTAASVTCRATIHAVSPLKEVQIIKDGERVWSQPMEGLDVTLEWPDTDPPVKEHYYYLHVIQADGQRAWSSPVWIKEG
jgi:hypothetical protein